MPALLVWFRLQRVGREHARMKGGMIVASNHRSFLDPFVIGALLPWRRRMQFVAKVELFENRWIGWLLSRLGAFPIRRAVGRDRDGDGAADRRPGRHGGHVPRGHPDPLGLPRATEARRRAAGARDRRGGLPVAVHGSDEVRRGWRIRPRKVKLRAGKPMTFPRTERPSPALAATVTERIWPNIELQWEARRPAAAAQGAVIGAGSWGTAVAVLLARRARGRARHPHRRKAHEILNKGENAAYLPGVKLPESLVVKRAAEIELAGCDLICLAVPSKALPNVVGGLADRVGSRASMLLLTKGFVQPMGALPNDYVSERVRAGDRLLGGPAHAREAAAGMAALVLGSADADLRTMLGEVFDRAGLVCERTDDVAGVEVAGRPRTPRRSRRRRRSATASTRPASPRRASGASASTSHCTRAHGSRPSPGSPGWGPDRDRARAQEPQPPGRRAVGGRVAAKIQSRIGQAAEALDSVPLIARTVSAAGVEAPSLEGLADLIEGEIDPAEWVAGLRRAERARKAARRLTLDR